MRCMERPASCGCAPAAAAARQQNTPRAGSDTDAAAKALDRPLAKGFAAGRCGTARRASACGQAEQQLLRQLGSTLFPWGCLLEAAAQGGACNAGRGGFCGQDWEAAFSWVDVQAQACTFISAGRGLSCSLSCCLKGFCRTMQMAGERGRPNRLVDKVHIGMSLGGHKSLKSVQGQIGTGAS